MPSFGRSRHRRCGPSAGPTHSAIVDPPAGRAITVAGAGPAGLAAAIAMACRGVTVQVFEQAARAGARFHGDLQGIENWSTDRDALDELRSFGIDPSFDYTPFHACTFFDDDGASYSCRSDRPLWYLVRRGPGPGTLDDALVRQAQAAGVQIEWSHAVSHLPDGGIVTHGPRRADVIATGYVFDTDISDRAYGVLSNRLAPHGYAYLLVSSGRGTLATCLFADFANATRYLSRTVEFFRARTGVRMENVRPFAGYGNFAAKPVYRRGPLLLAGEGAGLQDALFGFGMRYALVSGHLAGKALADGAPDRYERACRTRLQPQFEAAMVNRFLFNHLGNRGYRALLKRMHAAPDGQHWLHDFYKPRRWTSPLLPLARRGARRVQRRLSDSGCKWSGCTCVTCRCVRRNRAPDDRRFPRLRKRAALAPLGPLPQQDPIDFTFRSDAPR